MVIKKDPILLYEDFLLKEGIINQKYIDSIENNIEKEVSLCIDKCIDKSKNSTSESKEINDVYYSSRFKQIQTKSNSLVSTRYVDAIKNSLYEKMVKDESVIIMGQDIAEYGGVFKVTEGFVEKLLYKEGDKNIPVNKPIALISTEKKSFTHEE